MSGLIQQVSVFVRRHASKTVLWILTLALIAPCVIVALAQPVDYFNFKSYIIFATYVVYATLSVCTSLTPLSSTEEEQKQISRIEERNQYLLVGISILAGLVASKGTGEIGLPAGGFGLLVLGACYSIAGFIPFPIEWSPQAKGLPAIRVVKLCFAAAAASTSFMVIANLLFYRV